MSRMSDSSRIRAQFIETMGQFCQRDGLPPITGRLLGLMIFDGGRHSFADLAESLGVSRASISTSTRLLVDHGLILRVRPKGVRGDFFELAPSPYIGLLENTRHRAAQSIEMVENIRAALAGTHPEAEARLHDYQEFNAAIRDAAQNAIGRLNGETRDAADEIRA